MDTHYYGGIKKYQWVTLPLALHGTIVKKDGSHVEINIGEDENDPVFGVTDLLVHLSAKQLEKKGAVVVEGENLDILVGSRPLKDSDTKDKVKANILKLLKDKYDIEEEDFISGEIEVVPAGKSRDFGLEDVYKRQIHGRLFFFRRIVILFLLKTMIMWSMRWIR